jgi:hypothetical protein
MHARAGLDTYDEESQTSMKLEGCRWCLILGVEHIILVAPSEKAGLQRLYQNITMMRRLPKLGCGVPFGIWTTLVVEVEAILRKWDSARVSRLADYQVECF